MPVLGEDGCQDGPALLIGGVVGIRRWKVGEDGSLRGITYQQPWTHEENVAECWRMALPINHHLKPEAQAKAVTPIPHVPFGVYAFGRWNVSGIEWDEAGVAKYRDDRVRDDCGFPIGPYKECGHGFYAYTVPKSEMPTASMMGVTGIIEGYGRVLLGSNGGFKASKARMVAIHMPPAQKVTGHDLVTTWSPLIRAKYPHLPFYSNYHEMLYRHPLSDISHLTGDGNDALPDDS